MCHGGESHRLGSSGDGALAGGAVIGEPVSGFRIPCSAGKYREMLALEAGDGDVALAFANQFSAFPTKFPTNRNRGIAPTEQGIARGVIRLNKEAGSM